MAEQELTTALSRLNVNKPRPNFPLPRELRDKIYGYLLDSDFTRLRRTFNPNKTLAEPEISKGNAYRFHTNILAVNSTIHQEAEELLYKRNTFIVASYQWPDLFDEATGLLWVPIVSKRHIARMTQHSLRVHVCPGKDALSNLARASGAEVPVGSFLILAQDFKAFCHAVHISAKTTSGPAISVETDQAGRATIHTETFMNKKARSMQLRCELRSTKYHDMSAVLRHDLLTRLAFIIGPSQRVFFTGNICDKSEVESLKQMMGPSLLCQTAFAWSCFEGMMLAKDIADAALDHDDLNLAIAQYTIIAQRSFELVSNEMVRREFLQWHPELYGAIFVFHFEILVNIACGELKLQDMDRFREHVGVVIRFMPMIGLELQSSQDLPSGLVPYQSIVLIWWYIYASNGSVSTFDKQFKTVQSVIDGLREMIDQHCPNPHQTYDLDRLAALPNKQAILTQELFPLDQCSVSQLPFPHTSFYKSMLGVEQQASFRGWHDIDVLRSLDERGKASVNLLQKMHGGVVTDFDQL